MIGQYLSHTNERDTVAILQKNWEVNKAQLEQQLCYSYYKGFLEFV